MICHLGSDLDQSLDDPLKGPPDLLALEVKRPEHVEEFVGDDAHEQPGLVSEPSLPRGPEGGQGNPPGPLEPVLPDPAPYLSELRARGVVKGSQIQGHERARTDRPGPGLFWCRRSESNRHGRKDRGILRRVYLFFSLYFNGLSLSW